MLLLLLTTILYYKVQTNTTMNYYDYYNYIDGKEFWHKRNSSNSQYNKTHNIHVVYYVRVYLESSMIICRGSKLKLSRTTSIAKTM